MIRKYSPALFGALSVMALAAAGSASAAPSDGPRAERAPMTRVAVEAAADKAFARMDTNKDGVLNAQDRQARTQQRFARLDTDKNGALSPAEFSAHPQKPTAGVAPRDGEQRGKHRMGRKGHPGFGKGMQGAFHGRGGPQGDKAVTAAEFKAASLARFDKLDSNRDGSISKDERKAAREQMRDLRKQQRTDRAAQRGNAGK